MTTRYEAPWNGLSMEDIDGSSETDFHTDKTGRIRGAIIGPNGWLKIKGKDGNNPKIRDSSLLNSAQITNPVGITIIACRSEIWPDAHVADVPGQLGTIEYIGK